MHIDSIAAKYMRHAACCTHQHAIRSACIDTSQPELAGQAEAAGYLKMLRGLDLGKINVILGLKMCISKPIKDGAGFVKAIAH